MIVQLSEHVYPTPSLIAAPRAVELTVIEDDLCLPLAFSAALFVSGSAFMASHFRVHEYKSAIR